MRKTIVERGLNPTIPLRQNQKHLMLLLFQAKTGIQMQSLKSPEAYPISL